MAERFDAFRRDEWRVLIGDDARSIDEWVRADPVGVYGPDVDTSSLS